MVATPLSHFIPFSLWRGKTYHKVKRILYNGHLCHIFGKCSKSPRCFHRHLKLNMYKTEVITSPVFPSMGTSDCPSLKLSCTNTLQSTHKSYWVKLKKWIWFSTLPSLATALPQSLILSWLDYVSGFLPSPVISGLSSQVHLPDIFSTPGPCSLAKILVMSFFYSQPTGCVQIL